MIVTKVKWRVPKMIYYMTSDQALRAFMVVAFVSVALIQVVRGEPVEDFVIGVLGLLGGYLFKGMGGSSDGGEE